MSPGSSEGRGVGYGEDLNEAVSKSDRTNMAGDEEQQEKNVCMDCWSEGVVKVGCWRRRRGWVRGFR